MNLKNLRKQNNYSQEQIAEIMQLSQNTISSYECGKTEPDIKTLIKFADIFHVSLDNLVGRNYHNTIDKGLLSKEELEIIEIAKNLNLANKKRALSHMHALLEVQTDEDRIKSKF